MEGNLVAESIAIFAGGCFWCLEPVFSQLRGVKQVVSGYIGGQVAHPTYEEVCTGTTGHAEAIKIVFEPAEIDYEVLLEVFFLAHDPTTLNRQGHDVGTQYRSAVFCQSGEQQAVLDRLLAKFASENTFGAPVVTEVNAGGEFYAAEQYHQQYYAQHPNQPYCLAVAAPKIAKIRAKYAERIKPE
ncbi:peptide-methionine (S)-S-oxide reductase MsrA [Methylobacillus flagellatus]|uniref:peptide-methionine (S)-S-oxide reductase MsrA n=1 Tax=Methylobacillus flagellatus TaxID=405 RepID=UPI002853CE7D|nr:peptide-methionine (S)-S-oxide reductase MsrA [Methylobacillus flagellatus]MDR5172719.1 peptide-methionine (S)-S-oxide reductase MsrA [Methylobacillus flagellatus]